LLIKEVTAVHSFGQELHNISAVPRSTHTFYALWDGKCASAFGLNNPQEMATVGTVRMTAAYR